MDKKEIIKEFVDFVEGKMSFEEFQNNYEKNDDYKKILDDKKPNEMFTYQKGETINQSLQHYKNFPLFKWSTALGKLTVQSYIKRYLQYYNVPFQPTNIYMDEHKFRLSIQPSYVHIEDEKFLNEIIQQAPKELSKSKQKKWIKDKIKELFKFDNKPPRWVQDPEWPIVNGKPLVFKGQTKEQKNDERVFYTFYNPETQEETKVMQFY